MKRIVYLLAVLLLVSGWNAGAQGKKAKGKSYVIGFYNLENLFDTYHDEGKNDYEYLPDGVKSCMKCLIPHSSKGYDYIMSKIGEVINSAKKE